MAGNTVHATPENTFVHVMQEKEVDMALDAAEDEGAIVPSLNLSSRSPHSGPSFVAVRQSVELDLHRPVAPTDMTPPAILIDGAGNSNNAAGDSNIIHEPSQELDLALGRDDVDASQSSQSSNVAPDQHSAISSIHTTGTETPGDHADNDSVHVSASPASNNAPYPSAFHLDSGLSASILHTPSRTYAPLHPTSLATSRDNLPTAIPFNTTTPSVTPKVADEAAHFQLGNSEGPEEERGIEGDLDPFLINPSTCAVSENRGSLLGTNTGTTCTRLFKDRNIDYSDDAALWRHVDEAFGDVQGLGGGQHGGVERDTGEDLHVITTINTISNTTAAADDDDDDDLYANGDESSDTSDDNAHKGDAAADDDDDSLYTTDDESSDTSDDDVHDGDAIGGADASLSTTATPTRMDVRDDGAVDYADDRALEQHLSAVFAAMEIGAGTSKQVIDEDSGSRRSANQPVSQGANGAGFHDENVDEENVEPEATQTSTRTYNSCPDSIADSEEGGNYKDGDSDGATRTNGSAFDMCNNLNNSEPGFRHTTHLDSSLAALELDPERMRMQLDLVNPPFEPAAPTLSARTPSVTPPLSPLLGIFPTYSPLLPMAPFPQLLPSSLLSLTIRQRSLQPPIECEFLTSSEVVPPAPRGSRNVPLPTSRSSTPLPTISLPTSLKSIFLLRGLGLFSDENGHFGGDDTRVECLENDGDGKVDGEERHNVPLSPLLFQITSFGDVDAQDSDYVSAEEQQENRQAPPNSEHRPPTSSPRAALSDSEGELQEEIQPPGSPPSSSSSEWSPLTPMGFSSSTSTTSSSWSFHNDDDESESMLSRGRPRTTARSRYRSRRATRSLSISPSADRVHHLDVDVNSESDGTGYDGDGEGADTEDDFWEMDEDNDELEPERTRDSGYASLTSGRDHIVSRRDSPSTSPMAATSIGSETRQWSSRYPRGPLLPARIPRWPLVEGPGRLSGITTTRDASSSRLLETGPAETSTGALQSASRARRRDSMSRMALRGSDWVPSPTFSPATVNPASVVVEFSDLTVLTANVQ